MRESTKYAWPTMCRRFEGVTTWMYLDTKGLVTTGIGFLIDSVGAAQKLPWLNKDGSLASPDQIKTEWNRVKGHQDWKRYNGLNVIWSRSAVLHLAQDVVDNLLGVTTQDFWTQLNKDIPNLETAPADAQLAIMDEAWQNGKYFLKAGTVWVNTRAGVLAQDWTKAANSVPGTGDRADARKRLFRNAALVKALKLDPELLWDKNVPHVPVTEPVPSPPVSGTPTDVPPASPPVDVPSTVPTPTPPKEVLLHSDKWHTDYVVFRGGNFPPQTVLKLRSIPSNAVVVQGGISFAKASSMTHAGLGTGDLSVRGLNKEKVWKLCEELWEVGIIPCPRGFVRDSFQGKTIANINDGNEHVHFLDLDEVDHMHPEAQAQVKEILKGGDGLLGNAHYTGPSIKFKNDWDKSEYNPKNIVEEAGVFYVQTGTFVGLNQLREVRETKKQNDRISYVRKVKRWGRWNVQTSAGRFFAIEADGVTYLHPEKVTVTPTA